MGQHRVNERGDIVAGLLVAAVVALLGVIGYVVWQAAQADDTPVVQPQKVEQENVEALRTFTAKQHGISFAYPAAWSVSIDAEDATEDAYYTTVSVRDEDGTRIAQLLTNTQLGGTCPTGIAPSVTVERAVTNRASVPGTDVMSVGHWTVRGGDGRYYIGYGLSSEMRQREVVAEPCADMSVSYDYVFTAKNPAVGPTVFALWPVTEAGEGVEQTRSFPSRKAASEYVDSDEYGQIEAMLRSLRVDD